MKTQKLIEIHVVNLEQQLLQQQPQQLPLVVQLIWLLIQQQGTVLRRKSFTMVPVIQRHWKKTNEKWGKFYFMWQTFYPCAPPPFID